MQRTRLFLRHIATLCLLLYFGGVAVSVVHAAEQGPRHAETHMHGLEADCPQPHDELHCPACHFVFSSPAEPPAPWGLAAVPASRASAAPASRTRPSTLSACLSDARAPPRLA